MMGHTFPKKKKVISGSFSSIHQKIARRHSGDTITAKAFLRKQDKKNGTKNNTTK
jgi:hypothetical protein